MSWMEGEAVSLWTGAPSGLGLLRMDVEQPGGQTLCIEVSIDHWKSQPELSPTLHSQPSQLPSRLTMLGVHILPAFSVH